MVKILVFDTETTDKPPIMPGSNWEERQNNEKKLLDSNNIDESWSEIIDKWPSIIQLSYILYDTDDPNNSKIFNKYIDIPDNIVITEGSIKIHHITRDIIKNAPLDNRSTITEAIIEFLDDVEKADIVVGHNVQFDRKMIIAELLRLSKKRHLSQITDMMNDSNFECTMIKTTPLCQLKQKIEYKDKITGEPKFFYKIKSPKLSEAYEHFFGYAPTGESLHDALVDVVVCLRIYLKYNNLPDICGLNDAITNYIIDISPPGSCSVPDSNIKITMSGGKKKLTKSKRIKRKRIRKNKKTCKLYKLVKKIHKKNINIK